MLITELSQKPVRCARSSWRSKPPRRGWNKQKRAQAFGLLRLPLEVQRMISYAVDGDGASIRVDCSTSCHVKYYRDGFQGCSLVSQRVNSPLHGATFTNLLSHTVSFRAADLTMDVSVSASCSQPTTGPSLREIDL